MPWLDAGGVDEYQFAHFVTRRQQNADAAAKRVAEQDRILYVFDAQKLFCHSGIVLDAPHRLRLSTFAKARKIHVVDFKIRHK